MTTAPQRRAAAAALLLDRAALRVPVRGHGMLPALRPPMVLQLGPAANARVGDVLVFTLGGVRVTRRVVAVVPGGYRTSGDAWPGVVERVEARDVIGRVVAVWSDSSARARRVDRLAHRLRGWYCARAHPLRHRSARVRARAADLALRAQPGRRARTTLRLVEALTAVEAGDPARLTAALAGDAGGLRAAGARHRCVAVLGEAARRHDIVDRLPADVAALMRQSRLEAVLAASRMHRAVSAAVETLHEIGLPFALLKGAARVYAAAPGAAYHPSDDIDVLVRRADRARVVAALVARGYAHEPGAAALRDYGRHHHAVPLYPPAGAFPLELHDELAPPGTLSTVTDWAGLAPYLTPADGPAGTVLRLDPVGTALHLAIHAIGLARLRDVALLARILRALDSAGLDALRSAVRAERRDPVRLEAPVLLAARIAGVPWDAGPAVERYVRWALLREDLPASLSTRCDAVDAYFAHPRAPWAVCAGLVPWWSRGPQVLAVPARVAARCATNAAALVYARFMPGDERGAG